MREKRKPGGVMIGVSSILIIFILLCLTAFAALSLLSANADYKMAQKTAESVASYYAADGQAERIYMQISNTIDAVTTGTDSPALLLEAVSSGLPDGVAANALPNGVSLSYSVSAGPSQELQVELLALPGTDGANLSRQKWQLVSTREWEGDDSLNLWDGEDAELAALPTA